MSGSSPESSQSSHVEHWDRLLDGPLDKELAESLARADQDLIEGKTKPLNEALYEFEEEVDDSQIDLGGIWT